MFQQTTSRSFRSFIATATLGALACSLAAVCIAAEPGDPPQTTVKFADLKLSSHEGAAALYARIQRAAVNVCHSIDGRNYNSQAHDACVHDAIADAVAKVNCEALFIVYNARNGRPMPIVLAARQSR
jgi:UrcA family protein